MCFELHHVGLEKTTALEKNSMNRVTCHPRERCYYWMPYLYSKNTTRSSLCMVMAVEEARLSTGERFGVHVWVAHAGNRSSPSGG